MSYRSLFAELAATRTKPIDYKQYIIDLLLSDQTPRFPIVYTCKINLDGAGAKTFLDKLGVYYNDDNLYLWMSERPTDGEYGDVQIVLNRMCEESQCLFVKTLITRLKNSYKAHFPEFAGAILYCYKDVFQHVEDVGLRLQTGGKHAVTFYWS